MTSPPAPPTWLAQALDTAPASRRTTVAGRSIHWLEWGDPQAPTTALLHGGGAHAWWWAPVAALLARDLHVVALDLSGHGDSDHRDAYRFADWVAEVVAVLDAADTAGRPLVVGHSMTGIVAAMAAAAHGHRLGGAVAVDTPLAVPDPAAIGDAETVFAAPKRYASEDEARRRFRLLPDQPVLHAALLDHVAARSAVRRADGWAWKFDPRVFERQLPDRPADVGAVLSAARCPIAVVVAERSVVVPLDQRRRLRAMAAGGPTDPVLVTVPGGHHHLMFDRPRELAAVLAERAAARSAVAAEPAG